MPKYVGRVESDIWGNDRVVVRKEVSGGDVAAGAVDVAFNIGGAIISGFKERRQDEKARYAARQLEWAMEASDHGNYQGAIAEITDVIRKYPGDVEPYTVRAQINLEHGVIARNQGSHPDKDRMVAQAIADLNQVIRIGGNDAEILWMRASAYMLGEAYDYAMADANMCVKLSPNDSLSHLLRAQLFLELDDNEQALMSAQHGLQLEASAPAYLMRGKVYYALGEYEKALADFTRATKLDSGYTEAIEARAITYEKLGRHEAANGDDRTAGKADAVPAAPAPPKEWPPDEQKWEWCEIELNRQPVNLTYSLIAQGRRNGRTRLVAFSSPLPINTPTPNAQGELAALADHLKDKGWEPAGKVRSGTACASRTPCSWDVFVVLWEVGNE